MYKKHTMTKNERNFPSHAFLFFSVYPLSFKIMLHAMYVPRTFVSTPIYLLVLYYILNQYDKGVYKDIEFRGLFCISARRMKKPI